MFCLSFFVSFFEIFFGDLLSFFGRWKPCHETHHVERDEYSGQSGRLDAIGGLA